MGSVSLVARRRLARRWGSLLVAGILLGLGFGLCLASLAAARTTASAYDRILVATDAPDAAVGHGLPIEEAEKSLTGVEGIVSQRAYAGFRGFADGVAPVLTTAILAPTADEFPLEHPVLRAGRLPDPSAPDEVFVNSAVADGAGLEVGQRLTFRLFTLGSSESQEIPATVVGYGTVPIEAVTDETLVVGVAVFSRAFYEAHRDLVVYSASNVDLAPGFDARTDLAPAVAPLGHRLQSARDLERAAINEAIRPLVIVLVALGVVAFAATAVAAAQVIQRNWDRSGADNATLRSLGMARRELRLVELVAAAVLAGAAVVTSVVVMVVVSPVAPIGPLRDLDPARGVTLDLAVAALGGAVIVLLVALLTLLATSARKAGHRSARGLGSGVAGAGLGPSAVAGLTLALRGERGRGRPWRPVVAAMLSTVLLALGATFVASAVALSGSPARYGLDADLVAVNAYGDQSAFVLAGTLGRAADVEAATGFTLVSVFVDGQAVPGIASTAVKGDLSPTILRGESAKATDEIVVGRDTLENLGASLGDTVTLQLSTPQSRGGTAVGRPITARIVGVATFPPVNQIGSDVPRLGTGVLMKREAFLQMGGDRTNEPEFTLVRMVDGADAMAVIDRLPGGFSDNARTTTTWFSGAKPAEIRQLDAATPFLRGALVIGYVVLVAVFAHALWTRARANRHPLAVLRALGCTGRQLDAVTAWQAVPVAVITILLGLPVGIALGRWAFRLFAQSLAVVDDAATNVPVVGGLLLAVLAAVLVADVVSVLVARRTHAAAVLREG